MIKIRDFNNNKFRDITRHINFEIKYAKSHNKFDFDIYLKSIDKNLQREYVWTLLQRRELVMSVFLERKIPEITLYGIIDNDEKDYIYQVIDGKQRLLSLFKFIDNEFSIIIDGVEYYYKDLAEDWQRFYNRYTLDFTIAYEDRPKNSLTDKDKIDWFKLINFSGTPQDEMHIKELEGK